MADLYLIVRLAGRRVAFPAADVEAVVELEGLSPVPCALPHVAGLSALRSRVLTVIDCHHSLRAGCAPERSILEAVVVPSGGHNYALLVDQVEDVVETETEPTVKQAPLGPGWDRVASSVVEAEGDIYLLVDPHALIAGPTANAA
jgi:purine-binding chemotaxis protein CheW